MRQLCRCYEAFDHIVNVDKITHLATGCVATIVTKQLDPSFRMELVELVVLVALAVQVILVV